MKILQKLLSINVLYVENSYTKLYHMIQKN